MIAVITGTPGTGKSTVAKALRKKLGKKWLLVNDREFCKKRKIGSIDKKTGELVVSVKKLESALMKEIPKHSNLILEGHLFCEVKLPASLVIVLHSGTKVLEERLRKKKYSELKVLDNVFCEITGYCKSKVLENFKKSRILELGNDKGFKENSAKILKEIKN